MTGIIPTSTIVTEGNAAANNRSSVAYSNAFTAKVLKLKGLKINVAGNSLSQ